MLRFGVVALGVSDVRRASDFWSAALGYELREDGFGGWAKVLVPPDGPGTAIALQLSRTPPQDHPRLHLDLHAADAGEQETEAARLVSLGARRVDWDSYPEDPDFIVLEDPEGNRFCIVDLSHEPAGLSVAPQHSVPPAAGQQDSPGEPPRGPLVPAVNAPAAGEQAITGTVARTVPAVPDPPYLGHVPLHWSRVLALPHDRRHGTQDHETIQMFRFG